MALTAWAVAQRPVRRHLPWCVGGLPVIGKAILAAATAWPLVLLGRTSIAWARASAAARATR